MSEMCKMEGGKNGEVVILGGGYDDVDDIVDEMEGEDATSQEGSQAEVRKEVTEERYAASSGEASFGKYRYKNGKMFKGAIAFSCLVCVDPTCPTVLLFLPKMISYIPTRKRMPQAAKLLMLKRRRKRIPSGNPVSSNQVLTSEAQPFKVKLKLCTSFNKTLQSSNGTMSNRWPS
jgi:hypothetical protein